MPCLSGTGPSGAGVAAWQSINQMDLQSKNFLVNGLPRPCINPDPLHGGRGARKHGARNDNHNWQGNTAFLLVQRSLSAAFPYLVSVTFPPGEATIRELLRRTSHLSGADAASRCITVFPSLYVYCVEDQNQIPRVGRLMRRPSGGCQAHWAKTPRQGALFYLVSVTFCILHG
jgi:hypothetical protein